eukprot:6191441-Pleurochrysis_carterae.AAC.1
MFNSSLIALRWWWCQLPIPNPPCKLILKYAQTMSMPDLSLSSSRSAHLSSRLGGGGAHLQGS